MIIDLNFKMLLAGKKYSSRAPKQFNNQIRVNVKTNIYISNKEETFSSIKSFKIFLYSLVEELKDGTYSLMGFGKPKTNKVRVINKYLAKKRREFIPLASFKKIDRKILLRDTTSKGQQAKGRFLPEWKKAINFYEKQKQRKITRS